MNCQLGPSHPKALAPSINTSTGEWDTKCRKWTQTVQKWTPCTFQGKSFQCLENSYLGNICWSLLMFLSTILTKLGLYKALNSLVPRPLPLLQLLSQQKVPFLFPWLRRKHAHNSSLQKSCIWFLEVSLHLLLGKPSASWLGLAIYSSFNTESHSTWWCCVPCLILSSWCFQSIWCVSLWWWCLEWWLWLCNTCVLPPGLVTSSWE